MKLKVILVAIVLAIASAFALPAQTQAEIDNAMKGITAEINKSLAEVEGIASVTYDTVCHGMYINLDDSLISLCELEGLPRTDIKAYVLKGIMESDDPAEFRQLLTVLNQHNVKFGIRYTYKGSRYTDNITPADIK